MKRNWAIGFMLCVGSAGILFAQAKPAGDDVVVQADKALAAAYAKGDMAAAAKFFDNDFSWITTDGIMMERPDVLRAGLKPLVTGADMKIIEFKYGDRVVWIQNSQGQKFAAHFWVKRPEGWRLLHINEIAVQPAEPGANYRAPYSIPCDNPCKEVPYKPLSASEKAMLAAWQDQEGGTGRHDIHMGDNLIAVNSNSDGAARQAAQQTAARGGAAGRGAGAAAAGQGAAPAGADGTVATGRFTVGAAPALWGRSWDFGDAVVVIMVQPTYGGKAYWSSRIFGNHNGFW